MTEQQQENSRKANWTFKTKQLFFFSIFFCTQLSSFISFRRIILSFFNSFHSRYIVPFCIIIFRLQNHFASELRSKYRYIYSFFFVANIFWLHSARRFNVLHQEFLLLSSFLCCYCTNKLTGRTYCVLYA